MTYLSRLQTRHWDTLIASCIVGVLVSMSDIQCVVGMCMCDSRLVCVLDFKLSHLCLSHLKGGSGITHGKQLH